LAFVVDPEAECDGVVFERTEFPDLAVWFPYHSFKALNLKRCCIDTRWIKSAVLRKPDCVASIIDPRSWLLLPPGKVGSARSTPSFQMAAKH
jgi:hypothetical protein